MNTRNFKIKSKGIYKLCQVLVPEGWIVLQKVSKILKSIKTLRPCSTDRVWIKRKVTMNKVLKSIMKVKWEQV